MKGKTDLHEQHFRGKRIGEVILGFQDGLVNVLGVVLGVAVATNNILIILVAGFATTFAETISMGAVAYTSKKAERDYYESERALEEKEVEETPEEEIKEIRGIYAKKGFKGKLLNDVVKVITSNKKVWIDTMMSEELNLSPRFDKSPLSSGVTVFFATLVGSLMPILPFVLFSITNAMIASVIISSLVLFIVGAIKARLTIGNWVLSGIELSIIGILAALISYLIGFGLGQAFGTNIAV